MVLRRFTMPFEPMTIEHLGLRLYSTLPPVISELVANAYDADSPKVEVMLPAGPIRQASEVIVRDYGHGLDEDDIQNEYLPIGRNRRGEDLSQLESKSGRRRVTGRKGLGKLSGLGVAKQIQLRSIKDGIATCILIDYDKMKQWSKEKRTDYEPGHILDLSGTTDEPDGVEVTLRQLRRKNAISADVVRRGLARRLAFIGRSFEVVVNGQPIGPGDRLTRKECAKGLSWDVADIPDKTAKGLHLDGWIGFLERSSQIDRGVDIFATEKAVELGSFFNYKSTHAQFARAHLVGEFHADFLDGKEDLASTARTSVVWESETGQELEQWGQAAVRWAFKEWLRIRKEQKEEAIITVAGFDRWLKGRTRREQRVAKRMVSLLVDDPNIEKPSAENLLEIVKSSVEKFYMRKINCR